MTNVNWSEIMEINREAIEEVIKQAKVEAFDSMQGCHIDVEINETGEVWYGGLATQNSQSMSSWEGKTHIVCRIKSWTIELNEQENIKYDKKLYQEYLAQKEDGLEYAFEFMQEKYPEILKEWEENEFDAEIAEFDPSEILDNAIREQQFDTY